MNSEIVYFMFTIFSSIIVTLLAWIIKKISTVEAKIHVIEERMSWVIKLMNGKHK